MSEPETAPGGIGEMASLVVELARWRDTLPAKEQDAMRREIDAGEDGMVVAKRHGFRPKM